MFASIFNTFSNCFKIPELKSRIGFTFLLLAICRLAAYVLVPGLDGPCAGGLQGKRGVLRRRRRDGDV